MAQGGNNSKHAHNGATNNNQTTKKMAKPMIVERVNRFPMVSMAISMGFSQYDKLKSSNVTVADVITRAESWAFYVWEKMQPIVEKLQDPIQKADRLACNTLDYVEGSLGTIVTTYKRTTTSATTTPATN